MRTNAVTGPLCPQGPRKLPWVTVQALLLVLILHIWRLTLGDINSSLRSPAGRWRVRAQALCDSRITALNPALSPLPMPESGILRLGWGS